MSRLTFAISVTSLSLLFVRLIATLTLELAPPSFVGVALGVTTIFVFVLEPHIAHALLILFV